jgi:hypothetical protein
VPLTDGPTTDGPTTDGPTTDGPMTDGPMTDGPMRRTNKRASTAHRVVPHLLTAPPDGELAGLAAKSFAPTSPADPYWPVGRLLDALGATPGRDELISLIFFQREYAKLLVEAGRRDARADSRGAGSRRTRPGSTVVGGLAHPAHRSRHPVAGGCR